MPISLLDIAPAREVVDLGNGREVEVGAITLDQIVMLTQRFGNVLELLGGSDIAALGQGVRPLIGAVLAASCGALGNEAAETKLAGLAVGDQAALLAAVRRTTMPKGVRPFLQDLSALGLPLDGVLQALDQVAASLPSSAPSPPS